ncbi:hypothetical protein MUP05_11050 [Candidatus Bathyarchaeota archaeon]|nr:hypothetical protein [Candidatus Bathyarchaeota archaeon]
MAEWFARKRLGGQADFESTGTRAVDGASASNEAREVMRKFFGIDISSHRSLTVRCPLRQLLSNFLESHGAYFCIG